MPTIKVNTNILKYIENEMQGVFSRLELIQREFSSTSRNIDWEISVSSNIDSRILRIEENLLEELRGVGRMREFLADTCIKYNAVESENKKNTTNNNVKLSSGNAVQGDEVDSNFDGINTGGINENMGNSVKVGFNSIISKINNVIDDLKKEYTDEFMKEADKFGYIGGILKYMYGLNKMNNKEFLKGCSYSLSGVNNIVSNFGTICEKAWEGKKLKEILLWNSTKGGAVKSLIDKKILPNIGIKNISKDKIFKASYWGEIKEYGFKNAENFGSKAKVITKWAGLAFLLGANAVDNINETNHGVKNSTKRIVAETVTETMVDAGLGIVSIAASTALLGTSAPVVAVGAVSVGAVILVDKVTEGITEHFWGKENKKDFKELVSDKIIDGGICLAGNVSALWKKYVVG